MFNAGQAMGMDGDHLDISYRNTDLWPGFLPSRSIRSLAFHVGDPVAGPHVLLGFNAPAAGEVLDWKHAIDPMHYHGSDQFRVVLRGAWTVGQEEIRAGDFSFQEAGRVYQEHPGDVPVAGIFLVYGDRRGEPATLTLAEDHALHAKSDDVLGSPIATDPQYPHPAGPKGIAAIDTTLGGPVRGYLSGVIADLEAVTAGVFGDAEAGPAVYFFNGAPAEVVVPAVTCSTEVVLVVAGGACRVGGEEYVSGDLRIQKADTPFGPVVAGPEGLRATLMLGDRRGRFTAESDDLAWVAQVERLLGDLAPVGAGA